MDAERGLFVKKPIPIKAERLTEGRDVQTLEGPLRANPGDWLLTGVKGEQYPVRNDIFRATYLPVPPEVQNASGDCYLCHGLRAIAVHNVYSQDHGLILWVAHKMQSDTHAIFPCPACALNEALSTLRGGIRVAARIMCADEVCDAKHRGWEDCVMFRKWAAMAKLLTEPMKEG